MEKVARQIINPKGRYKIIWDYAIGCLYLIVFFVDPLILCFHYAPLYNDPRLYSFHRVLTYIFIIDMFLTFFTGIPKEDATHNNPFNDDNVDEDPAVLG